MVEIKIINLEVYANSNTIKDFAVETIFDCGCIASNSEFYPNYELCGLHYVEARTLAEEKLKKDLENENNAAI